MSAARDALEVALRRSIGFYLGKHGAGEISQEHELLVSGFLEAAEVGALRHVTDVGKEFDDYLPDNGLSTSAREELYDDILR